MYQTQLGRIEGIFTHQLSGTNYAFVVATLAEGEFADRLVRTVQIQDEDLNDENIDHLLQARIFKMSRHRAIVGLPEISSDRVWVVPALGDGEMWLMDWDIYFM